MPPSAGAPGPDAPGVVLVRVASDTRSVDLALPSALPMAELLPELAGAVGLLDAASVHGGYRVLTPDGRRLDDDASLAGQGIEDGAVLTVVAGVDDRLARRYDDPAEAMADVLAQRVPSWPPGAGRRAGLGAVALLLGLSVVALWFQPRAPDAVAPVALPALALVGGAVLLSRWSLAADAACVLAWAGVAHAALAAVVVGPEGSARPASAVAAAGAGALAAALALLLGLPRGRVVMVPAALLALLALAVGSLGVVAPVSPTTLASAVLTAAVLVGRLAPRLALVPARVADTLEVPEPEEALGVPGLDAGQVEADALLAHRIVVALEVTSGLLVVLLAPLAATLGPAGVALGLCSCAVVLLRSRRYRARSLVVGCLVCGAGATAATLGVLLAQHPDARAPLAGGLVAAALALAVTLPPRRGLGWHRAADLAESCCLVALLPLAVASTGVLGRLMALLGSVAA